MEWDEAMYIVREWFWGIAICIYNLPMTDDDPGMVFFLLHPCHVIYLPYIWLTCLMYGWSNFCIFTNWKTTSHVKRMLNPPSCNHFASFENDDDDVTCANIYTVSLRTRLPPAEIHTKNREHKINHMVVRYLHYTSWAAYHHQSLWMSLSTVCFVSPIYGKEHTTYRIRLKCLKMYSGNGGDVLF